MARFRRRKSSRRLCAAKAAARAQNVRFHSYVSERDRAELAAIIGSCSERILERLALEAVSASTLDPAPRPAAADAYRDWMREFVPGALDAIRAPDQERARLLARWADAVPPRALEPVPALVRRGLFALGTRLAREEVRASARRDRRDEAALEREFDRFVSAAATALAGRSIGVT